MSIHDSQSWQRFNHEHDRRNELSHRDLAEKGIHGMHDMPLDCLPAGWNVFEFQRGLPHEADIVASRSPCALGFVRERSHEA